MDPFTAFLASVFFMGSLAGQSEPQDGFYGCEVYQVEGANYYNFADPTCAQGATASADYILVPVYDPITGDLIGENSVATNNQ